MLKTSLAILIIALLGSLVHAQNITQVIKGRVIDKDSKTPLAGVNLVIAGSKPTIGTTTDANGFFRFGGLPVGRYDIQLFYLGYESVTLSNILIGAGKEVFLEAEMSESVCKLGEVTVKGETEKGEAINKMASVSARSFTVEETKRYAGSFNDPSRMASSYAGVSGSPEGDNDIVIRGNSPRGLLWRLEGIEIPNPNHFADEGATGGPISILNSNVLANSDFFTGAFPAEFGNAASGVFDIRLRKGNSDKREYSFQFGVIGTDISMEGPFSKGNKSSYLFNYRYSSLAILNAIGIKIVGDAVPKFQDFTFNLNFPTNKMGTFTLFGVGGLSLISEGDTNYTNDFNTGMMVLGITNTFFFDENTFLKTVVVGTGTMNKWEYSEPDEANHLKLMASEDFTYLNSRLALTLNKKFNARHFVQTGVICSILTFNLEEMNFENSVQQLVKGIDEKGNTGQIQAFVGWKYRFNDKLTLNSGAHFLQLLLNKNFSIEPRLGLKWQYNQNQAFNFGFGLHSKTEVLTNYLAKYVHADGSVKQYNRNMDFTKALHFVAGYENRIMPHLSLKTELYYQHLYNVPIVDSINSTFSALNYTYGYTGMPLANKGTGTNYGIDITLEKFFSQNYYFLVTTSLYNSAYIAGDGVERGTRYNGNYVFNLLGGKEFRLGSRTLTFSLKGSWAGGRRYTSIDLQKSRDAGYTVRDEANAFAMRADDFVRFDVKLSLRKERAKSTRVWEIDIQNVTNRLNIAGDYYDPAQDKIVTYTQLGLLPTLNYRIEF